VRAADDLLSNYQHVIDRLAFVTGSKGVFDVVVDGATLYSKHATQRHAEPGEILELFAHRFGHGVERYGS